MTVRSEDLDDLYGELVGERFGDVFETSPVTCIRCRASIVKDSEGRWVHAYAGLCSKAEPYSEERPA